MTVLTGFRLKQTIQKKPNILKNYPIKPAINEPTQRASRQVATMRLGICSMDCVLAFISQVGDVGSSWKDKFPVEMTAKNLQLCWFEAYLLPFEPFLGKQVESMVDFFWEREQVMPLWFVKRQVVENTEAVAVKPWQHHFEAMGKGTGVAGNWTILCSIPKWWQNHVLFTKDLETNYYTKFLVCSPWSCPRFVPVYLSSTCAYTT